MMELTEFQKKIETLLGKIQLKFNEPMSSHTSFRIGGAAEVMALPKNAEELSQLLKTADLLDTTPRILGAGTNILAPDEGLDGLTICLKDAMDGIQLLDNHRIWVAAGVTLTRAAVFAANNGLSGMEFAHGIPGTVGGGIYMNAGAYGGELKDICESVVVMTPEGELQTRTNEQMAFSYRHSILEEQPGIVTGAVFQLTPAPVQQIKDRMQELIAKRSASQPLDKPSAGSAFKRPVGGYAAALIDQAGLKGFRVGDAAISEKHAGFAVNLGKATAADVKALLTQVAQKVLDHSGVQLEPEVRIW